MRQLCQVCCYRVSIRVSTGGDDDWSKFFFLLFSSQALKKERLEAVSELRPRSETTRSLNTECPLVPFNSQTTIEGPTKLAE